MTFKFKVAAAALAISAVSSAQAQTAPEPDYTLSYNVGVVSQYRFRGMEQTSGDPATQAGVDFAHKNGLYAGAFTSTVSWVKDVNGASAGNLEVDLFGGYKSELAKDFVLDVGAIQYWYPGNDSGKSTTPGASLGYTNADTFEIYLGLAYGMASFKYSRSVGNFLGNRNSDGSQYLEAALNIDLGNGFALVPHYGLQQVAGSIVNGQGNYNDYSVTLSKDLGSGLSVSLAAVGTTAKENGFYQTSTTANGKNRFLGSNATVLGLKYSF